MCGQWWIQALDNVQRVDFCFSLFSCAFVKVSSFKETRKIISQKNKAFLRGHRVTLRFAAAGDFEAYDIRKPSNSFHFCASQMLPNYWCIFISLPTIDREINSWDDYTYQVHRNLIWVCKLSKSVIQNFEVIFIEDLHHTSTFSEKLGSHIYNIL
jgi:hypothetical protein